MTPIESHQMVLFRERQRLDGEAAAFDGRHPEVMAFIVRECRALRSAGVEHWGIGAAWELARHELVLKRGPGEAPYKLNNNHRAWYAREIMRRYGDLDGMFETRARRALGA